jgi:hypothetical protein
MLKVLNRSTAGRDLGVQLVTSWRGVHVGLDAILADTVKGQETSQLAVFICDLPCRQLDLGRGLDAMELTLPQAGFKLLEILLPPRARASLVIPDAREVCLFLGEA